MDWQKTQQGWRGGRYEIELIGPSEWQLSIGMRPRSRHRRASSARAAAERLERLRRRRSGLYSHSSILVAAAVVLVLILPYQHQTNPSYEPALELTTGMQSAFEDITADRADTSDFVPASSSFDGAVVPRNGTDLEVLVGTSNNECYVMFWGPDYRPRAGVLVSSLACRAEAVLGTSVEANYKRFTPTETHHLPGTSAFNWERVLPPPTRLPRWYFPAVIGLAFVLLRSLVSVSMVAHAGSETRRRESRRTPGKGAGAVIRAAN